VIPELLA